MKEMLKRPEIISGIAVIALYLAAGIVLVASWGKLPTRDLILQFNAAEGIRSLGGKMDVGMIFGISGLVIAGNMVLAKELFFKERVLAMILIWGSGLIALFTLIMMGLIVSIN
ncbi:MAG: hypothetical protein Q8R20_03070 [Nanoarchaeota archaeon]|nr:hypothetical protein [Nanoarchaeota archaeon]